MGAVAVVKMDDVVADSEADKVNLKLPFVQFC